MKSREECQPAGGKDDLRERAGEEGSNSVTKGNAQQLLLPLLKKSPKV